MIRGLGVGLLVLLVVIAAGFVAQRLFGSDSDHRMSEAQEAIAALPYRISMEEVSDGVLVGTAFGHLGVVVRFVVDDGEKGHAGDMPPHLVGPNWSSSEAGAYGVSKSGYGPRTDSKVQREEHANIGVVIDEALCRKSTGHACPP